MSAGYLAAIFPPIRRVKVQLDRDQFMLLMIAINEFLLGLETYLAHSISDTISAREWIPIIFGPCAGVLLLIAGGIAFKRRMAANMLGSLVFFASIVVGLLGSYYHITRMVLPDAPAGQQFSLALLVWAPPLLGPITFALVGVLGLSAAWQEESEGSGSLVLPGDFHLRMPLSKTRAYFFLIGLGTLITVISSAIDHARSAYVNPWVWIPLVVGIFSTAVVLSLGWMEAPTRADLVTYAITQLAMIATGLLGSILHILRDLTSQGVFVGERFIHDAPVMAPMLFANMGALALIVLLGSRSTVEGNPSFSRGE